MGRRAGNTLAALRGRSPFIALQIEYSLIERTGERELLPVADAFGLSVTAFAPMGGGVLTGKYTRVTAATPEDSKRAAANTARLTERNLQIAREVDRVADELGATSAQVAIAWMRHRGSRIIPIVGVRKLSQLSDVLGSLDVELPAEQVSGSTRPARSSSGSLTRPCVTPSRVRCSTAISSTDRPTVRSRAPYRWQEEQR